MTREDILKNPGYWTAKIQTALYAHAEDFMQENSINRSQLAKLLGVSKGYISQLLSGDFDHKLSKFVELSLSFGLVPEIIFKPINEVIDNDRIKMEAPKWRQINYSDTLGSERSTFNLLSRQSYKTPQSYYKTA